MKLTQIYLSFLIILISQNIFAQSILSLDMNVEDLNFIRPKKNVGFAGTLKFKYVNFNNNGIVLNVNNIEHNFDAKIFTRPTFLGFTTGFGNFGLQIEESSILNSVLETQFENTNLVFDDSQLNVSGKYLSLFLDNSKFTMRNFRLYCQNQSEFIQDNPANNIVKNCLSMLVFNQTSDPNNDVAQLEFEGIKQSDKYLLKSEIRNIELQKKTMAFDIKKVYLVTNDQYFINSSNAKMICAKDEDLETIDLNKIKKACTNDLTIYPLEANLQDKKNNTSFNLSIKKIESKNQVINLILNHATLTDGKSNTFINNANASCAKSIDSDVLNLMDVLEDCLKMAKLTLSELSSSKMLDQMSKDSSTKNILLTSNQNQISLAVDVKFIGLNFRIKIDALASLDKTKRQLALAVKDVKLPFGINSVKLLMYFLKKNIISKDISIKDNIITISL